MLHVKENKEIKIYTKFFNRNPNLTVESSYFKSEYLPIHMCLYIFMKGFLYNWWVIIFLLILYYFYRYLQKFAKKDIIIKNNNLYYIKK